jgi:hypothetical protein
VKNDPVNFNDPSGLGSQGANLPGNFSWSTDTLGGLAGFAQSGGFTFGFFDAGAALAPGLGYAAGYAAGLPGIAVTGVVSTGVTVATIGAGSALVGTAARISHFGKPFLTPMQNTDTRAPNAQILYHYTTLLGAEGIIASQFIRSSLTNFGKPSGNARDAVFGQGVYLTNIPPGSRSNQALGVLFKGVPNKNLFTNFVAINTKGLVVSPTTKTGIFVVPTVTGVFVAGRIVDAGPN